MTLETKMYLLKIEWLEMLFRLGDGLISKGSSFSLRYQRIKCYVKLYKLVSFLLT